jgi:hypothetical protein
VTGSPAGLYAGASADLQIVYQQLSDVLVVPTLAVSRSGGKTYVLMQSGETRSEREVVTGVSSGGQTQIVSGLQDGDAILVAIPAGNTGTGTGNGTGARNGNRGNGNGGGFIPGGGAFPGGGPVQQGGGNQQGGGTRQGGGSGG